MIQKENAFQSKAASAPRNVSGQEAEVEIDLQHAPEETAGKHVCCWGLVSTWGPLRTYSCHSWYWMSCTFWKLSVPRYNIKNVFGKFVNPQTSTMFLYRNGRWSLEWGAFITRQAKQVSAAYASHQNFTGKEKNQGNMNFCPLLLPRKWRPSMKQKRNKKEKKGKKIIKKIKKINPHINSNNNNNKLIFYPQRPWGWWRFLGLGAGFWPGERVVFLTSNIWRASGG